MKLTILQGDITKVKADAIVNAANSIMLDGGVAEAISKSCRRRSCIVL